MRIFAGELNLRRSIASEAGLSLIQHRMGVTGIEFDE
jgi:hypothetical protein